LPIGAHGKEVECIASPRTLRPAMSFGPRKTGMFVDPVQAQATAPGGGESARGGTLQRLRSAYDALVKQINCVCGSIVKGEDDDELWEKAKAHLRTDHPELVGKVSREDILAQAEEIRPPS
jgi:hypothetical protein